MNYKLSICVITMNRAAQLREALESCLACELPEKTQFVVIDNASTDNTQQAVAEMLDGCGYDYYYEKLPQNLGVGGGRNYAFTRSNGEYIYVLDDDAVIDISKNRSFFIKAIDVMDTTPKIATLTSQIYDTAWEANRVEKSGPEIEPGIFLCKMFCGGSHFLRKSFFSDPPYLPNKYGYEEIPPSLRVMDSGYVNAFCPGLLVIHKPAINKWDKTEQRNHDLLINGIATPYAIKKMMYPSVCKPLLWTAMRIRFFRDLRTVPNAERRFRKEVKEICNQYHISGKIKFTTMCKMVKAFKLSAF